MLSFGSGKSKPGVCYKEAEMLDMELQTGSKIKHDSFDHYKKGSDVISLEITGVDCLSA